MDARDMIVVSFFIAFTAVFLVKMRNYDGWQAPHEADLMIATFNARIDAQECAYNMAVHIDRCEPSVAGNKVIFDSPDLESTITSNCEGITFSFQTGSIELLDGRKIFKNASGVTHRIEICHPLGCRLMYA